jgi:hypothetical protein
MINLARQLHGGTGADRDTDTHEFLAQRQALYHAAHETVDPDGDASRRNLVQSTPSFKAMLALTAAQPEGLTPREIVFLAEYPETNAAATRIDMIRPKAPGDWYWLDAEPGSTAGSPANA